MKMKRRPSPVLPGVQSIRMRKKAPETAMVSGVFVRLFNLLRVLSDACGLLPQFHLHGLETDR